MANIKEMEMQKSADQREKHGRNQSKSRSGLWCYDHTGTGHTDSSSQQTALLSPSGWVTSNKHPTNTRTVLHFSF